MVLRILVQVLPSLLGMIQRATDGFTRNPARHVILPNLLNTDKMIKVLARGNCVTRQNPRSFSVMRPVVRLPPPDCVFIDERASNYQVGYFRSDVACVSLASRGVYYLMIIIFTGYRLFIDT